jgi:hypothetical protein
MNWGEKIFGKEIDTKDIFFIQVTLDKKNRQNFSAYSVYYSSEVAPCSQELLTGIKSLQNKEDTK